VNVMFSISTMGSDAQEASKIKEKVEILLKQHGLKGKTQGGGSDNFVQYSGNYKK
jgi:hypothetical protein